MNATDPPRVLVVATRFPLASETFVRVACLKLLDAVRELHPRGEVEVLSLADGGADWSDVERAAGLAERTRQARLDDPLALRLVRSPRRLAALARRAPGVALASIAPWRGPRALGGSLLAVGEALGAPRRYDAVVAMFGPAGNVAVELRDAGLIDGPIAVGFYGYDLTREPLRRGAGVYARLFREAALLLPNSAYLGERLRALGAPAEKTRVHRLGIDPAAFPAVDRSARHGPVHALAVGRFVEKKGFDILLEALASSGGDMTLRLVGEGPMRGELERQADRLGLRGRVQFAGWRSSTEVAAEMAAADLFVAPSRTARDGDMEGLPVVILEAMATGLPVVTTRHSGNAEIVTDGQTGWVVPEGNAGALAAALREASRRTALAARANRGRSRIEQEFDAADLAADLLRMLMSYNIS